MWIVLSYLQRLSLTMITVYHFNFHGNRSYMSTWVSLFQNVLARNSGLVNLETRTTTSPYWPKKVQAEFSHMYFCDYLATLGQMYTTSVTSGLAVNRANQTLALVFSHAFSDNESVAALRNCFNDSSLHPGFQQPVLKEKLKRMCSLVGIGLWSFYGLIYNTR